MRALTCTNAAVVSRAESARSLTFGTPVALRDDR